MKPYQSNICIIGAGPAGCSASLYLSKNNIPHLIVDKAAFPRDKICGDAFSGKVVDVFKELNLHIPVENKLLDSWGVTFVAPNGKALRVPFNPKMDKKLAAPGFIAKRFDFDNILLQKVKESEFATYVEQLECRYFEFEYEDGKWQCFDRHKNLVIEANYLLVADGAQSAFARHVAGIEQEPEHYAAGIRAYYKNVTGLDKDNFIELHFLKEFIPGYLWIFPLPNGEANVGIGLRSDLVKERNLDLKKVLIELIQNHPELSKRFEHAEMIDSIKGWGLPFGSKQRQISGNQFLLLGDAASLIDPFTGEGIGNAMISGIEAGKVMTQMHLGKAITLANYDEQVYDRLWKELQLSTKLQQLANQKWLFNWLINKATTNKVLRHTISNMFMDLDIRDQLKKPSFYFKFLFD